MSEPYYADERVTLWLGDCREVLSALGVTVDCVVADPPYGETSLPWDRWPDGWPGMVASLTRSMWCFGSLRMFLDRRDEFVGWKLSQDVVWQKPYGSGFAADRFKRVHEHALHWYRGEWRDVHHVTPRVAFAGPDSRHGYRGGVLQQTGEIASHHWVDDGTRLMQSVLPVRGMWRRGAVHPTEKPIELLSPLIAYACPPGGLVLDPFAGSGSTLVAARDSGHRAIGVEADEKYAEVAARRLAQDSLFAGEPA